MANLAFSALFLLIVLFFSSGCNNAKATDLAAASPPKEEPCYAWLGVCSGVGSRKEQNQLCKKRCTAYFHKDNDGVCIKLGGITPLCFCPEDCISINVKGADLARASPPEEEPCGVDVGMCETADKEKDEMCKKRCTRLFPKEHVYDGSCEEILEDPRLGFCVCRVKCETLAAIMVNS